MRVDLDQGVDWEYVPPRASLLLSPPLRTPPGHDLFDKLSKECEGATADDVIGAGLTLMCNAIVMQYRQPATALMVYDQLVAKVRDRLIEESEKRAP